MDIHFHALEHKLPGVGPQQGKLRDFMTERSLLVTNLLSNVGPLMPNSPISITDI